MHIKTIKGRWLCTQMGWHRCPVAVNSGINGLGEFVRPGGQNSKYLEMIIKASKTLLNAISGFLLAIGFIFAFDRLIDPIWNTYAEPYDIGIDYVELQIYGHKIRDLHLAEPPNLLAFAITEDGTRRMVKLELLHGLGPKTYPKGWLDFGVWRFTDTSPAPRPITKVEIEIDYDCILSRCSKTMGPFVID